MLNKLLWLFFSLAVVFLCLGVYFEYKTLFRWEGTLRRRYFAMSNRCYNNSIFFIVIGFIMYLGGKIW